MKVAAGVFFYAKNTERFLYLLRNDNKASHEWSIPGGKIEEGESLLEGLKRECVEEMSYDIDNIKLIPIQKFSNNTFIYHTFFATVGEEFIPILNEEHIGYAWVSFPQYPRPLHRGLFMTVNIDLVQEKLRVLTKNKSGSKNRS